MKTIFSAFSGRLFPLGTHVYREPHQDQNELMADLPLLKKFGFNMIKIQECWNSDEPREGEVDLSRIERVIARARELGLGVYLGLTMEQMPAWVWKKYPDCRLVYASGLPCNDPTQYCLPGDGKPGPCWDHPGARKAGERFIAKLAQRLGRFDNIWVWNVWQEIGFWPNDGGPLGFCYCPRTLARFREWLRAKYGSLIVLNRTWQSGFGDWDEVEPPRRAASNPIFIDWRWFMDNVYLARALEWKARAIKSGDPKRRPVFSHAGAPEIGGGAEWRWAKTCDFFGNSNYPAWWSFDGWDDAHPCREDEKTGYLHEIWDGIMLRTDYARCANGRDRPFWGAEFQGGPISTHLHYGRTPAAADIRRWMLAGLAAGMNGISFWNHRAEITWMECNGFGLLDARGATSERIEEAGRIGRALQETKDLFALGRPPRAPAAIVVNDDLRHFCQGAGNDAAHHLAFAIRGYYFALWQLGVAVDFIEAEEVASGVLAEYPLAILPAPFALDGAWFSHLMKYVERGGTLVSDACPGRFDRLGFCPRSQMVAGAEELFGARHGELHMAGEPRGARRWTPPARGFGEILPAAVLKGTGPFAASGLRASFWLQTLRPTTGRTVLRAGRETAGVLNRYGKGQALLLGTLAGHGALAHRIPGGERFFRCLLSIAHVEPDICGKLLRRRRVYGNKQAWFLINPTRRPVTETISTGDFRPANDLLGDSVVRSGSRSITVRINPMDIGCIILQVFR